MLNERVLWHAQTCALESRRARDIGRLPGKVDWIDDTIRALDAELEDLARTRKAAGDDSPTSNHDDDQQRWLSTREVSELLRWPMRTVQHNASKLGGTLNGGRLFFPASAIREHLEGMRP